MKRLAFAALAFGALAGAACTPDDTQYPVQPQSTNVPPRLEMQPGSGGGNPAPDANTGAGSGSGSGSGTGSAGGGGLTDGGIGDAIMRLDGRSPDATALLPDSAQSQVPPFP